MKFAVEWIEKHGTAVRQHTEMDNLRKTQCLCLNCGDIKSCSAAAMGLALCKTYGIAFAVTRCPKFNFVKTGVLGPAPRGA